MSNTPQMIGTYRRFYEEAPGETADKSRTWYHRTATMVCAYSAVEAGAELEREENPDEYFIWAFFTPCEVTAGGETTAVPAGSLVIVPPGKSSVRFPQSGAIWRGFTAHCADLLAKCPNADEYAAQTPGIAPLEDWPMPPDGYRLRVYDLDTCAPAGKPHCFRHRTAMTNFTWPVSTAPRPANALSPHTHADFEQASLIYAGTMVHHMRRAWSRDMAQWRPDEHVVLSSPAIAISKPPDVHTTQAVSTDGPVGLIDFFAPPRWDFSTVDGMVVNHDEYPMPAQAPPSYAADHTTYAASDPRAGIERRAAAR